MDPEIASDKLSYSKCSGSAFGDSNMQFEPLALPIDLTRVTCIRKSLCHLHHFSKSFAKNGAKYQGGRVQ